MPNFKSTGDVWTPVPNPEAGKQPVVPAALSLGIRHIQRKEVNEGKVTVQPERRATPKAKPEEAKAAGPPKEGTGHAVVQE